MAEGSGHRTLNRPKTLKKKVKKQGAKGKLQTCAVTLIQIAGGSPNLNPHNHILAAALPDEEMSHEELLPDLQAASVQSKTAMGARRP